MKHKPNFYVIPELLPVYEITSSDESEKYNAAWKNEMLNKIAETHMNYMEARYCPGKCDKYMRIHLNELKTMLINFVICVMVNNNDEAHK